MKFLERVQGTWIDRAFSVLPAKEKKRILFVVVLQMILGALDLLGVVLIGLVGTLAVSGIASKDPISSVERLLNFFGIAQTSIQFQVAFLGSSAVLVLVGKSVISFLIIKRTTYYLGRRGSELAEQLISKLVQLPLNKIRKRSLNENLFSLTSGVTILMLGAIASSVFIIADISTLFIMFIGLLFVDSAMALLVVFMFSLTGIFLYLAQTKKAQKLGFEKSKLITHGNQMTLELLQGFREIVVRNSRLVYAGKISSNRKYLAEIESGIATMQYFSKFAIEIFFLFMMVLISAVQFITKDAIGAAGVISMFLAASMRISPAVLRIQQNAISMRNSLAISKDTIELFEELSDQLELQSTTLENHARSGIADFLPKLQVENLNFTYPSSSRKVLNNVNFVVNPGEFVAVVGPSGSGKSTLFDCCLGIQTPDSGKVTISELDPLEAFSLFPGCVAFVPQEVFVAAASVRDNLLLGYDSSKVLSDEFLWGVLSKVGLDKDFTLVKDGLMSRLADNGNNLSGGQKQRLGIARALLTNPKLIFLDEATSNLDGETEEKIASVLKGIRSQASIVMIAHRLSTVREADRVIYLEDGHIRAEGIFEDVRRLIPNFARQAQLMGL